MLNFNTETRVFDAICPTSVLKITDCSLDRLKMNFPDPFPQIPTDTEQHNPNSQFEYTSPLKRQRYSENNPSNSAPLSLINRKATMLNPPVNGTRNIFFKTRVCWKFMEGNCQNGDNCTFAHGMEELRQPPPNFQELVNGRGRGMGNSIDDERIIHRMKICRKFSVGEVCPYGDKCIFLHERASKYKADMGKSGGNTSISSGNLRPMMQHRIGANQPEINKHVNSGLAASQMNMKQKPAYWKTRLCSKWEATGQCPFNDRCNFAHGQSELQAPMLPFFVPNDGVEAELMQAGSMLTRPPCFPPTDAPPTVTVADPPKKEEGREGPKNGFSKWKASKKTNGIYADWIDSLSPPICYPSTVEG